MMNKFDYFGKDYFKLFVKREGKVVLGKNAANLWILSAVMTLTFLAIAFSNASLDYLSYKMDDPFINWVDIKNEYGDGDFTGLEAALDKEENKQMYHYNSYQSDFYFSFMFFTKGGDDIQFLKCRFFQDMRTPLMEAILSKDNTVKDWRIPSLDVLDANTIGVVMTEEAMKKMGYDAAPSFIYFEGYCAPEDAELFDMELYHDEFIMTPIPVLAVVKALPGNVDIISSSYLYKQIYNNNGLPLYLAKEEYLSHLAYFIPEEVNYEKFKHAVENAGGKYADATLEIDEYSFYTPEIIPFRQGRFVNVFCYDSYLEYSVWNQINKDILKEFAPKDVHRVYAYAFSDNDLSQKAYLSVHFNDLNQLRNFEEFVRTNFNVKIEMSQINAKENFNAVSIMGNTLSWGIIIFAIICICMFIINLLQSYFQKVKRNLGTFKAFGISNRSLISIYILIILAIIICSIIVSISVTWIVQGLLHVCGLLKEGVYDYLSLWSFKTVLSIVIIVLASGVTVYEVMHNLLKSTPGDLIYDRQ